MTASSRPKRLKQGRPPLVTTPSSTSTSKPRVNARKKSAKATRTLINRHHQLQKARSSALAAADLATIEQIDAEVEQLGGLEAYQAASLTGQDKERGGDSSEKLVEWLRKYDLIGQKCQNRLRVLEVGALSSRNAISSQIGHGIAAVTRIDLHSQEPDTIEEADFMTFSIPTEKYDILSLSLVLNYVPDQVQRGEMLRRTTLFLKESASEQLPLLFFVLPLPCVMNSRYMTRKTLEALMLKLGYSIIEEHRSTKLIYMLFRQDHKPWNKLRQETFKKRVVNDGRSRNNFSIVLEGE